MALFRWLRRKFSGRLSFVSYAFVAFIYIVIPLPDEQLYEYVIGKVGNSSLTIEPEVSEGQFKLYAATPFKRCFFEQDKNPQMDVFSILTSCKTTHMKYGQDDLLILETGDPKTTKRFFPSEVDYLSANEVPCNWLSVGIQKDAAAEKLFHRTHPFCRKYGIEADLELVGLFCNFGQLMSYRIRTGYGPIVLSKDDIEQGIKEYYVNETVFGMLVYMYDVRPLFQFMSFNTEKLVQPLLKELQRDGSFDRQNVTICQIDTILAAEFLDRNFWKWISNSPYIPVLVGEYEARKRRVTFINVESKSCEEQFKFSKYFL